MENPVKSRQRVRFGEFELDLRTGELSTEGRKLKLQHQPFLILTILLERPGQLIERSELMRRLWSTHTFVAFEHGLNKAVNRLREALADSAAQPRFIESLPRRGYRFISPVEWITAVPVSKLPGVEDQTRQQEAPLELNAQPGTLTGKRVSHYRVLEILGGGGMGVVYKAEDIKLGRPVALKFLPEELANKPATLARFEREARAASALDHPNICAIYEFGEHEGHPFIAMQWLQGRTLSDWIAGETTHGHTSEQTGPFAIGHLLDLAIQITHGLEAAHQKGIIHRDIKPANIFITYRGEAKILDFGVAKLVQAAEEFRPERDGPPARATNSFTRTEAVVGTASYMSPEQARGEKLDTRTDLFSFGLVLYEMATGRQAFAGETSEDVRQAILYHKPAKPRKAIPTDLWKIISKALEKDRELRYQAAPEIRAELIQLQRKTAAMPKERMRRWLVAYGGAGLLTLIAIVLWLAFRRPAAHPELMQRKLTANSIENPVLAVAAISPDGRYLAYSERNGMHVQLIQTGETRLIPQPEELSGSREPAWSLGPTWFPDGTRFIANARPAGQDMRWKNAETSSIWMVPVGGSRPYKLRDHAEAFSVSPDGNLIAFGAKAGRFGDREIWVMNADGGNAKKLYETGEDSSIGGLEWSPDGQRVIYLKTDRSGDTFISRDLKGGLAKALFSRPLSKLHNFLWLADGRMLYILSEPGPVEDSCNIWQTRINSRTGELSETPVRVTNWAGFCLDGLSASADAKHLVFQRWAHESNILVADLKDGGARMGSPHRLTLNDNFNQLEDWTADSSAVIFTSNRNHVWGLFRQSRDSDAIVPLVTGSENSISARVSPDGTWVLYIMGKDRQGRARPRPQRVMRVPISGGTPELVLMAPVSSLSCAKSSNSCAIAEQTDDARALVFTALDPLKGRGRELARFDTDPAAIYDWDLSPDGGHIAVLKEFDDRIHLVSTTGGVTSTIPVRISGGLERLVWRADGTGFLTSTQVAGSALLLSVDLQGGSRILWQEPGGIHTYGISSRDGRYLAIMSLRGTDNVWMLENF